VRACVTLDLEPDHAGRLAPAYTAWEKGRVGALLGVLGGHAAPLSAFVVGSALESGPAVIDQFLEAGTDFHLHSYSHDLSRPDAQEEIVRGQAAFAARFGRPAEGYRAPEGRISPEGLARLEAEGFLFDSSLFPSVWPHPRYFTKPRAPHVPAGRSILEIPISTLGPARIIVSLSWMKLFGWSAYRRLLEGPLPDPLVFDMHLHDLWPLESKHALRPPWSWLYARNASAGLGILDAFLSLLKARGAAFTTMTALARDLVAKKPAA
jgi:peptidoglycan/xylan/chitin deacetylase (PgdA/CDA1 family)